MRRKIAAALLCLALLLLSAGCGTAGTPVSGAAEPAAPSSEPDPLPEGQLTLMACVNEDVVRAVVQRFTEQTGCRVTYACVPAIQAKELLLSDGSQADVLWGATADVHKRLADRGLLLRYAEDQGAARFYLDTDRCWKAVSVEFLSIGINPQTFRYLMGEEAPLPRSLEDLASPLYRGKLVLPDLDTSYTGTLLASSILRTFGDQRGMELLEGLWGNAAEFAQTDLMAAQKVALGLYPITVGCYSDQLRMSRAGFPLESQVYALAGWSVAPVSVLARGSNRDEAVAFREFLVSSEVQELIGALDQAMSPREDIPAPEHLDADILDFPVSSSARVNTSYFKDEQVMELYQRMKENNKGVLYAEERQPEA